MNLVIEIISIILLFILLAGIGISVNKKMHTVHGGQFALVAYAGMILMHATVSIWNGFYGPIFGASNDALEFHKAAVLYFNENSTTDLLIPGWIYSIFLAVAYELTIDSWAIGCLFSTVVFGFLCLTSLNLYKELSLKRTADFIDSDNAKICIFLLIGLIPTSIVLTSITMREIYQMLFLCILLIYSVKFIQKPRFMHAALILLTLFLFVTLHTSFIYYTAIYLVLFAFIQFRRTLAFVPPIFFVMSFMLMVGFLLIADVSAMSVIINKFIGGTGGSEAARAYYGLPDISGNIFSIMRFMFISFLNYMVRPFPWEMTSIIDLTTFAENALRIFFIWRILVLKSYLSVSITWTIFAALLLELLWGMGTLNWGTAQRHHLVAWPLFVISYFAVRSRYKASHASASISNLSPELIRQSLQ